MPTIARTFAGAACLMLCAQPTLAQPSAAENPLRKGGLGMSAAEAAEVLLRDVCMTPKYEGKSIAEAAQRQGALEQSAKLYNGGPSDKAYRIGPLTNAVYAVDWADGSCTVRVSKGDSAALRALAEGLILARPEGFVRGSHAPADAGRVIRTVYCADQGGQRLVASVTTPGEGASGRTPALSSTFYRTSGPSALCVAAAAP